jgi:ABC-2 type transport system ATP-binding protein
VLESIRALSQAGKTIVLTTHYLEEADQLAHRIVVIDHGVVIADATPREIKARIPSKRINFRPETAVGEATFSGLSVQNLEIADHRVHLLSHEPEAVLRALFERGVVMRDLEVTGADLEEAFLSMTRRA